MQFKQIKNDLMEALAANKPKTAPYDTEAQVVRVEGSTAWVHIPGGVDETPVAMTINASAGDTVRVRVGNGTAWLVGNDSAPPTDDHTAIIAARQAAKAAEIARKTVELTEDLNQRIANANGLYETRITQPGGATITYMHNKPNLANSDIQMMISDVGVLVTANGTDASPTWYGLTVDGNLIANILQANGINADWINTGALVIYDDDNNEIFRADKTGKIFRWDMGFSAMNNLGILTFMEDSPYETQFINHASLRVINTFYRQSLGDYATELFAANGLRTGRVSRWDSYTINDEVVEVPVYEECGTYGSDGIELYDTSSGSRYRILFLEQKTPTANNSYSTAGSGLTVNNRSLEQWINEATAQISSGANMDSITKPGTYWSPNASISASITHTPFTDSAFQVTVKKFGSILVQIAWQNKQDSYIKYRIYTSNGSWGSWCALARQDVVGTIVYKSLSSDTSIAAGSSQKNMASISCAAGIWSVTAHASFQPGGTVGHYRAVSIGTSATNATYGTFQCGASNSSTLIQTSRHITLTSTTTLYLNVYSQDAVTVNANGTIIEAVRLR